MFPRLRALFRSRERQRQLEAELDEEIQFHLEQEAARNRRAGMDEAAARTAALRSFGGVAQTREQVREARGVRWLEPLGQDLRFGLLGPRERNPVVTVVGVVGRVKLVSLREQGGPLQAYIPFRQAIAPADATLVLHSRSAREPLLAAVRRLAAELARDQPLRRIGTFSELRDKHLAPDRLTFLLVAAFGAVALLLAVVGLYGALAYAVAQRRREIAVRVALGAHAGQIARLVLRQGLGLAAAGTALGLGGALLLTRTLAALLHGVKPGDPATLAAVTALMLLVALAASLLPARQAARTDPMAALRKA